MTAEMAMQVVRAVLVRWRLILTLPRLLHDCGSIQPSLPLHRDFGKGTQGYVCVTGRLRTDNKMKISRGFRKLFHVASAAREYFVVAPEAKIVRSLQSKRASGRL